MLAGRYRDQDPTGWWVSEKLDGCRAFWDGTVLRTKDSWLPIDAPDYITEGLPRGKARDGELWAGYGTFQLMRVLVQFPRASDPRWRQVRYCLFDAPTTDAVPVEKRWERLAKTTGPHLDIMPQWRCAGMAAMANDFAAVLKRGGEGLMLRAPGHHYEFGRSSRWLKVKPAGVD